MTFSQGKNRVTYLLEGTGSFSLFSEKNKRADCEFLFIILTLFLATFFFSELRGKKSELLGINSKLYFLIASFQLRILTLLLNCEKKN